MVEVDEFYQAIEDLNRLGLQDIELADGELGTLGLESENRNQTDFETGIKLGMLILARRLGFGEKDLMAGILLRRPLVRDER